VSILDAARVATLVNEQLAAIRDPVVREALGLRVQVPVLHHRSWDYGVADEQLPCWLVLEDPSTDTGIAYSEVGFGPASPWGLVSLGHLWFGMDCGWFTRLEDAFVDSHLGGSLQVWDLIDPHGSPVLASVTLDEAFAARDRIDAGLSKPRHHVVYRSRLPGGIP
jgi:hypothetical protein